jgi:hypothetical protein
MKVIMANKTIFWNQDKAIFLSLSYYQVRKSSLNQKYFLNKYMIVSSKENCTTKWLVIM